jgi:hypothetical protein
VVGQGIARNRLLISGSQVDLRQLRRFARLSFAGAQDERLKSCLGSWSNLASHRGCSSGHPFAYPPALAQRAAGSPRVSWANGPLGPAHSAGPSLHGLGDGRALTHPKDHDRPSMPAPGGPVECWGDGVVDPSLALVLIRSAI